jgi:hypothetical protein
MQLRGLPATAATRFGVTVTESWGSDAHAQCVPTDRR